MRIGVMEWASCGGVRDASQLPDSIRREGWAMCRALIVQLRAAGYHPVACLLPELSQRLPPDSLDIVALHESADTQAQWRHVYTTCDLCLIVAPESDNVLLQTEAWFSHANIPTIGCDPVFIDSATDKWSAARSWSTAGLAHPPTWLLSEDSKWISASGPLLGERSAGSHWVIKARSGCGCEGIRRMPYDRLLASYRDYPGADDLIVQPWIEGHAFSRSAIIDAAGQLHWLPVVRQLLDFQPARPGATDAAVSYQGGCVMPDMQLTAPQSAMLAKAIQSLPGRPRGWVGVDFLIDHQGQLLVIEVNPRLTTSFVGLSVAGRGNLAHALVCAGQGQPFELPEQWQALSFTATQEN